jgi:hypothetical protein
MLIQLREQEADPLANPKEVLQQFQVFHASYPEVRVEGDLKELEDRLVARFHRELESRAQLAYDALLSAESQNGDPNALLDRADLCLREFAGTSFETKFREHHHALLDRLDNRDVETARGYSRRSPFNFQTRKEMYQAYLDKRPTGIFATEAREAIGKIEEEWDKYDFRQVRDLYVSKPGEVTELQRRCDLYTKVHPRGRYLANAHELLVWIERIKTQHPYKVILRSGNFDTKVAHFFSRGPDLSVEIEVNGLRYGPSPVIANRYDPEWNYEFPRPVMWKLGDPVKIRVTDHDWKARLVLEYASSEEDPLSIHMLGNENWLGKNVVRFEANYTEPVLPNIE